MGERERERVITYMYFPDFDLMNKIQCLYCPISILFIQFITFISLLQVRRAWFDLINDLLVTRPHSLAGSRDDLTSCVLTSLDDSSGNVLPSVWTAFLSLAEVNEVGVFD